MAMVPPPSSSHASQPLSVGVPPLIAESLVVPLVRRFTQTCPGTTLRLQEAPTPQLLDWTLAGRIDLAIVFNAEPRAGLRFDTIANDDLLLVGAAGRPPMHLSGPVTLAEVLTLPLLMPRAGSGLHGMLQEAARQRGVVVDIAFWVDGIGPILSLVREGRGFTCLPRVAVAARLASGELMARPIEAPALPGVLAVARDEARQPTSAMRGFVACALEAPSLRGCALPAG